MADPIPWDDRFLIGVADLDQQHRELVALANHVLAVPVLDKAGIVAAYGALERYVQSHFEREERYMQATAFPGLAAHRVAHRAIRLEMESLLKNATSMRQVQEGMRNLVYTWVLDHIGSLDGAFARHLAAIPVARPAGGPP